jgi:transposase-like protein
MAIPTDCPKCKHWKTSTIEWGKGFRRYRCANCGCEFSIIDDTEEGRKLIKWEKKK